MVATGRSSIPLETATHTQRRPREMNEEASQHYFFHLPRLFIRYVADWYITESFMRFLAVETTEISDFCVETGKLCAKRPSRDADKDN